MLMMTSMGNTVMERAAANAHDAWSGRRHDRGACR